MRNVPNALSLSRLIATVVVFVFVLIDTPWAFISATVFFALAAATDYFDGYFARRWHVVSPLGIFLDLTADKVFVSAILIALIQIGLVPAWMVFIIITREFLVTSLRSVAAAKGKVIPAGMWGKQKTFITLLALGALLLAKGLGAGFGPHHYQLSLFPLALAFNSQTITAPNILLFIADIGLILAVIWTAFSGIEYLIGALPIFRQEQTTSKQDA